MFALGMIMILLGAALFGADYLGLAQDIPGIAQIPATRTVSVAIAAAGALLVMLYRRPAN